MSGYLVATQVPIFIEGSRAFVGTEWKRSLTLLRDSLVSRYAKLVVLGPSLRADQRREQALCELTEEHDGIRLVPSIDWSRRARHYWMGDRARWRRDLASVMGDVDVVHAGLGDLYRPVAYDAFNAGVRAGKATVFVQDTDIIVQAAQLSKDASFPRRAKAAAYSRLYERAHRAGVAKASLSLLKGRLLEQRYGPFAQCYKLFDDTSYCTDEIVSHARIAPRLASLTASGPGRRPVRLVYCGRLVPRKGLAHSIRIIHAARALGADVELEIIGDGPQRDELERLVHELGLQAAVTLPGRAVYGRDLIERLATFDAILFTPLAEDTPRMIFDGYAAALPLVAYAIDYVRERSDADGTVAMINPGDIDAGANVLLRLCARRDDLVNLAQRAMVRAVYHAADRWYARRAEWTFEAIDRHYGRSSSCSSLVQGPVRPRPAVSIVNRAPTQSVVA